MRAVGYLHAGGQGPTVEEQRQIVRAWARSQGHRLVAMTQDDAGLSEAVRMILDLRADGVVVSSLDRLGEDPRTGQRLSDQIHRAGGQVWSAATGEEGFGADRPESLPQRRRVVLGRWRAPDR